MKKVLPIIAIAFFLCNSLFAQTNPTAQTLPYSQNFGTTTFSSMPTGTASWTVNSSPIGTQTNAQNSTTNGNASVTAATAAQTTGGSYGYATSSNGRFYIQTSSNATNGTNQLACAINTTGWTSVLISYKVEMIAVTPRTVGVILQYRIGTSGSWTNISGSTYSHNSSDRSAGAVDNFTNLSLPSGANNNSVVQLRWATWRGSEAGNSSGIAIDNISVTASSSQSAYYFRSKQNGNWNDVNTWEASSDNSTWNNATITPKYTANTITIQNAHTVTLTATDTIDQVVVNGKLTYADISGSTPRINNGTGSDLIINGTFEDIGPNSIAWATSATWSIGSSGTILRTRGTSSNNWRDKYDGGISNIPATANWIVRKTSGDNPSLSSTGGMYYPNLSIENNTGSTWTTSSSSSFTGSSSSPIVKGNLNIGGSGTGNVSFLNDNTNASPVLVTGSLTIKSGSTLRNYGTGFEVQGNLILNGSLDHSAGNAKIVLSGSNNQTISSTGTITFKNLNLNKTSTSATVTLSHSADITSVLTLSTGYLITTTTNLFTFDNGSNVSGVNSNSFISGPVKKIGNTAFVFPTGKSNNYQPISISAPSNSAAAYTAEYFHTNAALGTTTDASIQNISNCEYWTLNNVGTVYPVYITLGWNNQSCLISPTSGFMRLTEWNGTKWIGLGNGSVVTGEVSSSSPVSTFGSFTLAQTSYTLPTQITPIIPDSNYVMETSEEFRNGVLFANLVKIKTNPGVISGVSYTNRYHGTSCITSGNAQLKVILENAVLQSGGDPSGIEFERSNIETQISSTRVQNIYRVWLPVKVNTEQLVADLRGNSSIELACPPYIMALQNSSSYFDLGTPYNVFPNWHVDKLQAPSAWVFMQNAGNEQVAISDAGLAKSDHVEFSPNGIANLPYSPGTCGVTGTHATVVSSVIAAKPRISAGAGPISVGNGKILVNSHSHEPSCGGLNGGLTEVYNLSPRPRVLNLSLAFVIAVSGSSGSYAPPVSKFTKYIDCQIDLVVLEQLVSEGMNVYASTANSMWTAPGLGAGIGTCLPSNNTQRGVGYPFGLPGVTGVGGTATDNNLKPTIEYGMGSGVQSYHLSALGNSSGGNWNYNAHNPETTHPIDIFNQNQGYLEITAPGKHIDVATPSSTTSISTEDGTSLSAPMVATVAASMIAVNPSLTNTEIYNILMNTADKVNYNPNGLILGDLNATVSYNKGYRYSNNGDVTNGGFLNPELDYVMGYGRVNMLSAVMNAAGLNAGGFSVDNTLASSQRKVWVENVNDHSYLTFPYDESFEYDAVLNQNSALVTFNGTTTSPSFPEFELKSNSTFRLTNNAKMVFNNGGKLTLQPGAYGQITKYVIQKKQSTSLGGILELRDNTFDIPSNTLLEVDAGSTLTIDNANLIVHSGGILHIKNGATLNISGATLGKITSQNGSYLCIESGATVNINTAVNELNIASGVLIGIPALVHSTGSCQNPCSIAYSGSGSVIFSGSCIAFDPGTIILNESCSPGSDGSITISVSGGTSPYTYNLNGGTYQSSNVFSGLTAATYTVGVLDAAAGTTSANFTVLGPLPLTLTMSKTAPYCNGGLNSGTATVSVAGGTEPFTYLWSNSQTTQTAVGLIANTYSVTVTDSRNCTATASVTVTNSTIDPPYTSLSATINNAACYGGNGSATVTVVGGVSPVSKTWFDAAGNLMPLGGFSLPAGSYLVYITDGNGCARVPLPTVVTITQPTQLLVSTTSTDATSCSNNNGSVTASPSGGTAPYTYSWNTSPVQTTQTAVNLIPGNYLVTVTDFKGCTQTAVVSVGNSGSSLAIALAANNISCYGLTDGNITANVTGGTPPYTYLWSNGQFSSIITNLSVGNYGVSVTDAVGNCQDESVTITSPTLLSVLVSSTPKCSGGSLATTVTGGTTPYTYLWSPGAQTTFAISSLANGTYNVVVTDANGCTAIPPDPFGYPTGPVGMTINVSTTNSNNCSTPNGSATVISIANGTSPYTYSWSSGHTTASATGLATGTYTVMVTGTPSTACSASAIITINSSTGPGLSVTKTDVTWPGGPNNGTASVSAYGGTPPYTYLWSPGGQTTSSITGLAAGTYNVLVTDALGNCNALTVTIDPSELLLSLSKVNPTCIPGNNGTAMVDDILGGTAPYTYSWNTSPVQTTQTATGLSPGVYTVTVTDANGNTGTESITIPAPSIGITLTSTDVTCYGGSNGLLGLVSIIPLGIPPYTYSWSPGGYTIANPYGVPAGTYTLTVTDGGGCTATGSVSVAQPDQIILSTSTDANNCILSNGTASVWIVAGGDYPYTYSWNTSPVQTTQTATGLASGSYTVIVTDASGCSSTQTVHSIPLATITSSNNTACPNADGAATVSATGGTGAYSYLWNDPSSQTTAAASNLGVGTYTGTVTDALGCSSSASATINNGVVFDYPTGYVTSPGENWNSGTTIKVNGMIQVPSSSTFTISNGTIVEFAENSGITIYSTGVMNIIGGSTLRGLSSCGNMWNGIDVYGNTGAVTEATLNISGASTIQDAHIGINSEPGEPSTFNLSSAGTIHATTGANFINNRVGIKMQDLTLFHSGTAINSYITNCNFTCNAPLLDASTYLGEGTSNFIQMEDVSKFTMTNNIFTGNTSFAVNKRGTAISGLNSDYDCTLNNFNALTTGIYELKTSGNSTLNLVVNTNTFDNVQHGIYDEAGFLDEFTGNTFTNIPSANALGSHTYGIYLISSGGFNIEGNDFAGSSSTTPLTAGSHGIAFDNTGIDGGVCFSNTFAGTDFGIHTQNNNQNLKIRCNQFAVTGTAHNSSAWYTESGFLKQQGLAACSSTPEDAAGNRWLSTSSSGVQDVFTNINITYYANPLDQFSNPTTVPSAISGVFTGLSTSCANQVIGSCTSSIPGGIAPEGGGSGLRSHITDSLGYYAGEQQLEMNRLLRQYLQSNSLSDLETLLTESGSAESQKQLSQYYLGIKNYSASRIALSNVVPFTASEVVNLDSLTAIQNTNENNDFCRFMNCMIDLGESGRTFAELDSTELNILHDIAGKHLKISANAETVLAIALNEHYIHPIVKGETDQNRSMNTTRMDAKIGELLVYPNPFSGTTTVEYTISENAQNTTLYLYDAIGNQIRTYPIKGSGKGKLSINSNGLKNGIYSCHLVSDNKTIGVTKLVVIE